MAVVIGRRRSLTASASVIVANGDQLRQARQRRKPDLDWQRDAWAAYRALGEIRFSARYIGNSLSRIRFYVGTREHPGAPLVPIAPEAKGDDAIARDLILRIRGRDGTLASLLKIYGVQQFIAGESYLVGEQGIDSETWEFLSTSELQRAQVRKADGSSGTVYSRNIDPDGNAQIIGPNSLVIRMWQRDPEFRERSDSALRSVLPLCDALITAQAMQTAGDRSRLVSNGILLVAKEAGLPKVDTSRDGSGGPADRLQLADELLRVMQAAMADPGSAAALAPIILEIAAGKIGLDKAMVLIRFDREVDKTITARIDHLIRRIAQGLDLTPEKLLGTGDVNHWTAWQVSDETVTAHLSPLAAGFAEDTTVGYLTPALKEAGIKKPVDQYAIGFDTSDLTTPPNREANAQWLYEHDLLAGEHTVEALGYSAEQMPDDDETRRKIRIAQAYKAIPTAGNLAEDPINDPPEIPEPPAPIVVQPPVAPVDGEADPADGTDGQDGQPVEGPDGKPVGKKGQPGQDGNSEKPGDSGTKRSGPQAGGKRRPPVNDKAPDKPAPNQGPKRRPGGRRAASADMVTGMCISAIDTAIRDASGRLRSRALQDATLAVSPSADPVGVARRLGREGAERLGLTPEVLWGDSFRALEGHLSEWCAEPVVESRIVAGVMEMAAGALFDPAITHQVIEDMLSVYVNAAVVTLDEAEAELAGAGA